MKSLSCIRLLATPWTAAHQAPPSMGFSRQEYWSGMPLPSPNCPHTTKQFCTAAGCPTIQLNSDTICPETASDSKIRGSVPQDCPLLQMPIASPGCHLCFRLTTYRSEIPKINSSGSINSLEWLTGLRETFHNYNRQKEEMDRVMYYEKAQIFHGPPPRMPCSPKSWLVHQPGSSLKLVFYMFMEASLHKRLNHWPRVTEHHLQSLSPPWRWRITLKIVTLSSHDCLLRQPAPLYRPFPQITSLT